MASDLAGYNVHRGSSAGGPYAQVNPALVVGTGWQDSGVTNETMYYYVVTAVDTSTNESSNSIEASAMPVTPPDTTPPAAPSGIAAIPGDGKVDLDWDANLASDLAGYNVHRGSSAGGLYAQVNPALVVGAGWQDSGVTSETMYYYVVTAVDTSTNESSNSIEASAMPVAPPDTTPPPAMDTVTILKANYNGKKKTLSVDATSSEGGSVTLEVFIDGVFAGTLVYNSKQNKHKGKITSLSSKPVTVRVVSDLGGEDSVGQSEIGGKGG